MAYTATQFANTIADLKNLKGLPGAVAEVGGYYAEGDGAGGQFMWTTAETLTASRADMSLSGIACSFPPVSVTSGSGDGTTVTLTYAATFGQFQVGGKVQVAGAGGGLVDGIYSVTAATWVGGVGTVSFLNPTLAPTATTVRMVALASSNSFTRFDPTAGIIVFNSPFHQFQVGDQITVFGETGYPTLFNGNFTVQAITPMSFSVVPTLSPLPTSIVYATVPSGQSMSATAYTNLTFTNSPFYATDWVNVACPGTPALNGQYQIYSRPGDTQSRIVFHGVAATSIAGPITVTRVFKDSGINVVPTGGDGSSAWVRIIEGFPNVRWWGAKTGVLVGAAITANTAAIQQAIYWTGSHRTRLQMMGGPYYTDSQLEGVCAIDGDRFDGFIVTNTIVSSVAITAPYGNNFAIKLYARESYGTLTNVTVYNNSTGNGIWAYNIGKVTALNQVAAGCSHVMSPSPVSLPSTALSIYSITAAALTAGSTATATTNSAHGLILGDTVCLYGSTEAGYNGLVIVTGVPASNQFTYALTYDVTSLTSAYVTTSIGSSVLGATTTVTSVSCTTNVITMNYTGTGGSGLVATGGDLILVAGSALGWLPNGQYSTLSNTYAAGAGTVTFAYVTPDQPDTPVVGVTMQNITTRRFYKATGPSLPIVSMGLTDGVYPSGSNSLTQVTFATPHGMTPGNYVTIMNVGNTSTSYGGTFPILGVSADGLSLFVALRTYPTSAFVIAPAAASASPALQLVAAQTTWPNVGLALGTDHNPGAQVITCVLDSVVIRDYQVGIYAGYYSNANDYRKFYQINGGAGALNTIPPSTFGYGSFGRGCEYLYPNGEQRSIHAMYCFGALERNPWQAILPSGSEQNTITGWWLEGEKVLGMDTTLNGGGNLMINPYGFVGQESAASLPINVGAASKVLRTTANVIGVENFSGFSNNLFPNSEFTNGLGPLTWTGYGVATMAPSGAVMDGFRSIAITKVTAAITGYIDITLDMYNLQTPTALGGYSFLVGKTITVAAFGQAATGVDLSVRLLAYSPSFSPNSLPLGTSSLFSQTTPTMAKCTGVVPVGTRYLVFRIYYDKAPGGAAAAIGSFSMPMLFVGKDIDNAEPRHASDGANTFYGTQTIYNGQYNQPHLVLGTVHLWIDTSGANPVIRVKNSAPTVAGDGVSITTSAPIP